MCVNLKTIINIDFASAFFNSCAVAFSVPTVKLYMASNVDPMYFKISLAIDTIAGGGFGLFMSGNANAQADENYFEEQLKRKNKKKKQRKIRF